MTGKIRAVVDRWNKIRMVALIVYFLAALAVPAAVYLHWIDARVGAVLIILIYTASIPIKRAIRRKRWYEIGKAAENGQEWPE